MPSPLYPPASALLMKSNDSQSCTYLCRDKMTKKEKISDEINLVLDLFKPSVFPYQHNAGGAKKLIGLQLISLNIDCFVLLSN